MTPPPLESRLHDLAAGVHAPANPDARAAVGRRTRVLRRRRRAVAAGSGVLVAMAVVGAVAVMGDAAPDDTTTVAEDTTSELPAIVIDLDGWEVTTAEDTAEDPVEAPSGVTPDVSVQTFRTPEGDAGPSIVLTHQVASDALEPDPARHEEVMVGDVRGLLSDGVDGGLVLEWQDPTLDAAARIEATGLSVGEVVVFAKGLEAKDDQISHPAGPEDTLGFVQTTDVRGLVEQSATARHVAQSDGAARADLTIGAGAEAGSGGFQALVADLRSTGRPPEEVTVLGRPGLLFSQAEDRTWTVVWQSGDGAAAQLALEGVDRADVGVVIAALRVISEDEWDALVRDHPPS